MTKAMVRAVRIAFRGDSVRCGAVTAVNDDYPVLRKRPFESGIPVKGGF